MNLPLALTDGDPTRELTFFVPGEPLPESKRTAPARLGKEGQVIQGRRYETPNRRDWKAIVHYAAYAAFAEGPWQGPLELTLTFQLVRPPSWSKKPTKAYPWPDFPYKKPDTDNLTKVVKDGMTSVAWLDDAQICREIIEKTWADKPGVLVTVRRLSE